MPPANLVCIFLVPRASPTDYVLPGLRSTFPQPSQMGNFRHQSFRDRAERDAIDREKDTASLKSVRRTLIPFSCKGVYVSLDGRTI